MKIISLNAYAGTLFEPLMAFVKKHQNDTDIFCFQEILDTRRDDLVTTPAGNRAHLFQDLSNYLPDFQGYFTVMLDNVDTSFATVPGVSFGLASFIRKSIDIRNSNEVPVLNARETFDPKDGSTTPALAQIFDLAVNDQVFTLCNAHGIYYPADKLDSPDRLTQSRNILAAMHTHSGEKIIMGDFNLLPDTDSIRMFAEAGYRNLVADHNITTTRGSMNKQLHPEFATGKYGFQEFADYTFITPGLRVKSFEVPDLPLSDHLPMILEIDQL